MCEFIHNGRCMWSEWYPAGVHRFEEGVLVLMFLSTDLKKNSASGKFQFYYDIYCCQLKILLEK